MGTWGVSNFADDGAADYAATFREKLLDQVREAARTLPRAKPDNILAYEVVLLNIEILATLAAHIDGGERFHEFIALDVPEIKAWQEQYLALFDRYIQENGESYGESGKPFLTSRRAYIANTFERYIRLSEPARS